MQTRDDSGGPPPPDVGWPSGREHSNTYSFILRVEVTRVSGGGPSRLLFWLEDVTAGSEWRFADFESVAERLARRVQEIRHRPDLA